jgi:hypothetical protein
MFIIFQDKSDKASAAATPAGRGLSPPKLPFFKGQLTIPHYFDKAKQGEDYESPILRPSKAILKHQERN